MLSQSLRVLIAAENTSAQFGGEAALALHYFRVMRGRGMDVWLVTHARTRAELSALYPDDARICYIEDTGLHRTLWRMGKWLPDRIAYLTTGFLSRVSTQIAQRSIVQRLVREHGISVVHQPMPVSPREPSMLHGFGVPVLIGPMNGGMDYPPAFRRQQSAALRAVVWSGRAVSHLMNRCMPGKRRAAALLVANRRTREALPRGVSANVIEVVENGVDLALWKQPPSRERAPGEIARFVFVGRLVDWKAVDLLLDAFAAARDRAPMSLLVIGAGAMAPALEQQARRLGILGTDEGRTGQVHFAGWMQQSECAVKLQMQDCLVLPSLMECGGAVVLEAMALGMPVIATAWGGPTDYLDASCGILVEPTSRSALIDGLADAMVRLAQSADLRLALGRAGREKVVREFDWETKVDRMIEIYRGAMQQRGIGDAVTDSVQAQ